MELEYPIGMTCKEDMEIPLFSDYEPEEKIEEWHELPEPQGIDALFGSLSLDKKVDEWIGKLEGVLNG